MRAAYKASFELYEEEATKNPAWKKIYEPWKKFRDEEFLWHRVAEQTLATFLYSQQVSESSAAAKKK
jgi:TRAP-type mannitol/chloroaromatic compound transport system substrate-binding protein